VIHVLVPFTLFFFFQAHYENHDYLRSGGWMKKKKKLPGRGFKHVCVWVGGKMGGMDGDDELLA